MAFVSEIDELPRPRLAALNPGTVAPPWPDG